MAVSRRRFLQYGAGIGAGALVGEIGIYRLVDQIMGPAVRAARAEAVAWPDEQHVMPDLPLIVEEGFEIVQRPLHHEVITAVLAFPPEPRALTAAQRTLEQALRRLEQSFPPSPDGLGLVLGWGPSYFRDFVAAPAAQSLPVDLRASAASGVRTPALLDAMRFPSDPDDIVLEDNHLAVLLRSDNLDHIADGTALFTRELTELFQPMSIRQGFVGGGYGGKLALPKRMAVAAGIPGAEYIPDSAELFMGFTSGGMDSFGRGQLSNFEAIPGLTDQGPGSYFRAGTIMHLSHLYEDLVAWYTQNDYATRQRLMFRPGLPVEQGRRTVGQPPEELPGSIDDVNRMIRETGDAGHAGTLQPISRLQRDTQSSVGYNYLKGNPIPQRADFNTLDNPFAWSARPDVDRIADGYAAGMHFVMFTASTDEFNRNRLAMDGIYPDGRVSGAAPRSLGINAFLRTTHRQNFLVPPRAHRSFPLAELL